MQLYFLISSPWPIIVLGVKFSQEELKTIASLFLIQSFKTPYSLNWDFSKFFNNVFSLQQLLHHLKFLCREWPLKNYYKKCSLGALNASIWGYLIYNEEIIDCSKYKCILECKLFWNKNFCTSLETCETHIQL